ncbi:type IX secretion system anionic LPS delivery protein PorZ [Hyunsoonleella rubra]|uniref:ABC transporter substrate-binding protein n=1 Tax=Hyunsoonleella rubra TaxID=1737062 RepID=A0ABW5TB99_9FLAO
MIKRILLLLVCLVPLFLDAQDFSALWKGHFSYFKITKVINGGENQVYGASENAVFRYDTQTREIEEITTVNGLSGDEISTIFYSDIYELLLIGYENGLIEVVLDNDDDVLSVVDILDKTTIPPSRKKINHFNALGNLAYIATDFGISVYDMERLEFGDTYLIGNGGSQIGVNQTTVFGEYIYAACSEGQGIRKGSISNPNLIDFQNWTTIINGDFLAIEATENNIYTVRSNRRIYELVNDALVERVLYGSTPVELTSVGNNYVVTTNTNVFVYDESLDLLSQVDISVEFDARYLSATLVSEDLFIGTQEYGILNTPISNPTTFEEIHPDGPLLNSPFSVNAQSNNVWITFGEYSIFLNPYPLNSRGFSRFNGDAWTNTPYSDVLGARCLNSISINPYNNNQVFISSFFNGLLEVNDGVPSFLFDQTNSALESLISASNPDYVDIRVGMSKFDTDGLLWTITSRITKPLKSYDPSSGNWNSYAFTGVLPDDDIAGNLGYRDMAIGPDGTKWVVSYNRGIIGFNENGGNPRVKALYKEEDNMPSDFATAVAVDRRGQVWVGTFRGLRVIFNASGFFEDDDARASEIIIEQDGIARELLFQQLVSRIVVDGSNNKWIGTVGSGLFYLSSDGQNTIFHFTKENSPLPSNTITDISLDDTNGTLYIATDKGLVSFASGGSGTTEDFSSSHAYPNPVRPNFNIVDDKVKIKDIPENVNIKITDIEGNLVAEAQSRTNLRYNGYNLEIDGGTAYWNGKNLANNVVASGVYLIMLADMDSFETKVIKLMVVR